MIRVNFVSAAFRNKEDTLRLIKSYNLSRNSLEEFCFKFYLVNDFPEEKIIDDEAESIYEINTPGDIWWTKSIQLGINKSLEFESDFTILSGTDLEFTPDSIKSLIDFLIANNDLDVLHPKVEDSATGEEIVSAIKLPNLRLYFPTHVEADSSLVKCDMLSARFVLIRSRLLSQYKFDEKLIQYASDYDIFLQMRRDGKTLAITNKSSIKAKMERTGISRYNISSFREYFKSFSSIGSRNYFPSIIYFYTKNFGLIYGWCIFLLKSIKDAFFIIKNKIFKR